MLGNQQEHPMKHAIDSLYNGSDAVLLCRVSWSSHATVQALNVCHLPTNFDTVLHSRLTSSPEQALTSKVVSVSGLSPDSLVMTVVVVDPSTVLSL